MTKKDIIGAAYRAWARNHYQKMSLREVADELKVTKPAFYRHFANKDELLSALEADFFESFGRSFLESRSLPVKSGVREQLSFIVDTVVRYFHGHPEELVYLFWLLHSRPAAEDYILIKMNSQLSFEHRELLKISFGDRSFQSQLMFAINTAFFFLSVHHFARSPHEKMDEDQLLALVKMMIERGLGSVAPIPGAERLRALDKLAQSALKRDFEEDPLLDAIARTVAKHGPWNASMELVAANAGISKSGLYSHFCDRQTMLRDMFQSEFEKLDICLLSVGEAGEDAAEKLYLGLSVISGYLICRPNVLTALNWVRIRRIHPDINVSERVSRYFSFLKSDAPASVNLRCGSSLAIHWLLFLCVNLLIWSHHRGEDARIPERLVLLHTLLLKGIQP